MSSGKDHDKAIQVWVIPYSLVIGLVSGIQCGVLAAFAFSIGGYWFSPDLDTKSIVLKRWGILKFLWWPYRKLIRHRSIFSHSPIIGTSVRLLYLFGIAYLAIYLLQPLGVPSPLNTAKILQVKLIQYPKESLSIIISLEASAWLHLLKDGDPFPMKSLR